MEKKNLTQGSEWTIERYFILINVQLCDTLFSGNGAAAECCVSSRPHGESHQWWDGTCGPCPNRGSSCRLTWGHAFPCACARPLWSIACRGCVWRPCGRGRSGSPRRICMWSLRPPSKSSAHGDPRSDGQHAPEWGKKRVNLCELYLIKILFNQSGPSCCITTLLQRHWAGTPIQSS